MKTILIPTNFTDVARHATDYAIGIYGHESLKIILLNAFEQPKVGRSVHLSLVDILRKNSEKGLLEDKLRIQENFPDKKIDIILYPMQGDLSDAIIHVFENEKADLIVMGSEGSRELVDIFIESQTARVIKTVDYPMLIVPPIATIRIPESIIFATDGKAISDESVIKELTNLCTTYGSRVRVLHIYKNLPVNFPKAEYLISVLLKGKEHDFSYRQHTDIPTGIYKFIYETNSDIVCLIKRKGAGSLVERLFHSNVSRRISKHVKQTLLLLTDQNYPAPL